ncbi:MAG: filamentous hemagglutinin N-terminal domain-containing protein, partial [Betaproteobacteria bacterium]
MKNKLLAILFRRLQSQEQLRHNARMFQCACQFAELGNRAAKLLASVFHASKDWDFFSRLKHIYFKKLNEFNLFGLFKKSKRLNPFQSGSYGSKLRQRSIAVFSSYVMFQTVSSMAAAPTGGTVSVGTATIAQTASQTTITQTSAKAAINWSSFSIDPGYKVQYIQPDASSIALNRVTGNLPTSIQGQLLANGQVWILNPNGVYISSTGTVNAASFLATTHAMTDQNFMSGNYTFTSGGITGTYVTNQGNIVVSDGGYAVLTGQAVRNDGYIQANLGQVVLAGANTTTIDLLGNKLISFAITQPVDMLAADGRAMVDNAGTIRANGGQVLLTAKAASQVINQVINTSGVIEAKTASLVNGQVVLDGGVTGQVTITGSIDASGQNTNETGGAIKALGNQITINNAALNASGDAGGGSILIGGGWQGGSIGAYLGASSSYAPALSTTITKTALLNASAITSGNGGQIVAWSDVSNANSITRVAGTLLATGGRVSGNGGNIETSGHHLNVNNITVSTKSPNGKFGSWLLDPDEFTIGMGLNDDISGDALTELLASNSIYINTTLNQNSPYTGNIYVKDQIGSNGNWSANTSLSLNAANSIYVNSSINASGDTASINLTAGKDVNINSPITLTSRYSLFGAFADNDININANLNKGTLGQFSAQAGSGSFVLNAGKDINVNSSITLADPYGMLMAYAGKDINVNANISALAPTWQGGFNSIGLQGQGNITINSSIEVVGPNPSLNLTAGKNIDINSNLIITAQQVPDLQSCSSLSIYAQNNANLNVAITNNTSWISIFARNNANINAAITNNESNSSLYISSGNNVNVNAPISINGDRGSLNIGGIYNGYGIGNTILNFGPQGAINLPNVSPNGTGDQSAFTFNGVPYTVINSLADLGSMSGTDLQGINGNLSSNYVLGSNINAALTNNGSGYTEAGFTPIGNLSSPFVGNFNGLGHSISNLFINRPAEDSVGLFGYVL